MSIENKMPDQPVVNLRPEGPMEVRGNVEILGIDGKPIALTLEQLAKGVILCRCGKSRNMPFCDGAHTR